MTTTPAVRPYTPPVGPYELPRLRFDYAALEPILDSASLRYHHGILHARYVETLNAALAQRPEWCGLTIEALLRRLREIPADIRSKIRYHGGGHANHQFFWKILGPPGSAGPQGALSSVIDRQYGSLDRLKRRFAAKALAHRGPGWAFLVARPVRNFALEILILPRNDSVLWLAEPAPGLLICDLWPHTNRHRPDYRRAEWLEDFWSVVDWAVVEARYAALLAGKAIEALRPG